MATPEYDWQKSKLKLKSLRLAGAGLHQGYGPEGKHSLYLPTPGVKRKLQFVNGKATVVVSGGSEIPPHIELLRRRIIATGKASTLEDSAGYLARIMFPDVCLAEYSAALLATQYDFTDDDLALMHSGKQWLQTVIIHAMGGQGEVDALGSVNVAPIVDASVEAQAAVTRAMLAAESPRAEAEVVETLPPGRTWPLIDAHPDGFPGSDYGDDFDPTSL